MFTDASTHTILNECRVFQVYVYISRYVFVMNGLYIKSIYVKFKQLTRYTVKFIIHAQRVT